MDLLDAARRIHDFEAGDLTARLSQLEIRFEGLGPVETVQLCDVEGLDSSLLEAGFEVKKLAGQINVLIHAAGILTALPAILGQGEIIQYLSLGAGNTGKDFDIETNHRVAEFKFINWRGGAESIRQNSLFKDFYTLAEHETSKLRCLYVLGLEKPLNFLNGGRSLRSVMSRNAHLAAQFKD
ncbi:MAG: hypothetical protein IID30_15700, partial [Planctomycetes bacterium]|nr:hypothetical protein [Planctomycetota bacterium]